MIFLKFKPALCAAAVIVSLAPAAASAQSARVGALQCHLSGGVGMILAENQALDCVYKSDAGGPVSHWMRFHNAPRVFKWLGSG